MSKPKVPNYAADLPILVPASTRKIPICRFASEQIKAKGLVRLISTVDCFIEFGRNPTATDGSMLFKADQPEYFSILPGNAIAVIARGSSPGHLYLTEAA